MRPENPIGVPFYHLSEVDSTNNYAMRQVQAHLAEHGTTYLADYQNAGKGQRGKTWNALAGENVMMSVVLKPSLVTVDNQFILNVLVALACYDFFDKYTNDGTCIKWPNDIYWRDRKAGGILIENILQGETIRYSIVGIGININQTLFAPELPNPVSLKQITGKTFNVAELTKDICSYLETRWASYTKGGKDQLLKEYSSKLYKRGELAMFKIGQTHFESTVEGVNEKGELLLKDNQQVIKSYTQVEWIKTN